MNNRRIADLMFFAAKVSIYAQYSKYFYFKMTNDAYFMMQVSFILFWRGSHKNRKC